MTLFEKLCGLLSGGAGVSYLVEVIERSSGKTLGFTRLNRGGGRSCVEVHYATQMTFVESWLVIKEIERDRTPECDYKVKELRLSGD